MQTCVAEANSKLEKLSAKTEQDVTEIQLKLKHSETCQASLANLLNTEKQAHAVALASLEQTQQKNVREVQELHAKVIDKAVQDNQLNHIQQGETHP